MAQTDGLTMTHDMVAMSKIAGDMAHNGIRVVRMQWTEYDGIEFGVSTRKEFDRMCEEYDLVPGDLFGDVRKPCISASGTIGVHPQTIRLYGPAEKR